MALFGDDRLAEINRAQRAMSVVLRRITIEQGGKLSMYETFAAAIRAVEDIAHVPTEEIRLRARDVSASCGLETDFAADAYQRQRDEATAKAGAEQERRIWTQAIKTYFDGTAVMDVERYVEEIRKGVESKP